MNMNFRIGRLGRKVFVVSMLISFGIIILLALLNGLPIGVGVAFICINFAWMIVLYIGRLHDVGYSGWWTLLVMLLHVAGMVALAVWPGEKETNKYGEVPPSFASHLLHFWRMRMVNSQ